MIKLCNPMINSGPRCAVLYFFAHRVPQFIIGFHKFSSGYAILVPGYKFRGCQFEIPGYTRTAGGRRGLSYLLPPLFIHEGFLKLNLYVKASKSKLALMTFCV